MLEGNAIRFVEIDSDQSFANMAGMFGTQPIHGVIRIPASVGTGNIRKVNLEEGFYLRTWDLEPCQPIRFNKMPAPDSAEKSFHIIFLLSPRSYHPESIKLGNEFPVAEGMNVLLISGNTPMEFEVMTGFHFKAIDLSFSFSWLMDAYKDASEHTRSFIAQLEENIQPTVIMDACTFTEYKTLTALHERSNAGQNGVLELKVGALSLLSDFFNRLFSHLPQEVLGSKIFHYHRMLQVEKILKDHLQKKLPSIEVIAHEVALSVSTLKRHFKLMYGKSIYEYYLDMKMDLARQMLQEKPLTINEVAAILDYEKVSSFIDMFKKHFGYSPGNIRKNGILR